MIYTRDDVKHSGSFIPFLSCIFLAGQQILEKEKKLLDAFLKTKQNKKAFLKYISGINFSETNYYVIYFCKSLK